MKYQFYDLHMFISSWCYHIGPKEYNFDLDTMLIIIVYINLIHHCAQVKISKGVWCTEDDNNIHQYS